ncbi:hypothetical protein Cgig2_002716 [Carnegiea gigantea]|uniref:Uncharacterized protein n=1 Tax=Carnegiea gigantea TaxID=171969 RepID=A0A9Q1GPB4_9CARY|nr:hypothetical protein Cgig2_002716 [Carnegiea gigantea]
MAGSSRRTSTTQSSGGLGSSRSDFNNIAKYYCNCSYEAVMYETDDNYMRHYLVCPLEVNFNSFIANVVIFQPLVIPYNSSSTLLTCVVHVPLCQMEYMDPLASDASSPLQAPHVGPRIEGIWGTVVPIICNCGTPAEMVVDPHVPHIRRSVCRQRMSAHDILLKHSPMRHDKAITIRRLQA